jgi:AcrR family transcriptional regulator
VASGRERLLASAMRLFGERGYAATSVAQIESDAGLTPGAGGLYAHFPSKEALLRAGLQAILQPEAEVGALSDSHAADRASSSATLADQLAAIAQAGLARLEHDKDFNRILVRDLRTLPDLLQLAADQEIVPIHARLADQLAVAGQLSADDALALAAVLIGATTHLWLMTDIFGAHPAGVGTEDYMAMLVRCAVAVLAREDG